MTDEKVEELKVDEESIKQNIEKYASEKLADMIVAHRYLGIFEGTCIIAMEELVRRRNAGDNFQYEKYIETNMATLPKLEFTKTMNFNSLIQMFKGKKK